MSTEGGQWFSALSNNELRERQNVRKYTTLDRDYGDGANATLRLASLITNSIVEHWKKRAHDNVLMLLLPNWENARTKEARHKKTCVYPAENK